MYFKIYWFVVFVRPRPRKITKANKQVCQASTYASKKVEWEKILETRLCCSLCLTASYRWDISRPWHRTWHWWSAGYIFSRAWHRLHTFPRLTPVTCFPRLAPAAYFPALGTGCLFSRAWHRLLVFPRLAPAENCPALVTCRLFSSLILCVCLSRSEWFNSWAAQKAFLLLTSLCQGELEIVFRRRTYWLVLLYRPSISFYRGIPKVARSSKPAGNIYLQLVAQQMLRWKLVPGCCTLYTSMRNKFLCCKM